jgi:hypothetical protein
VRIDAAYIASDKFLATRRRAVLARRARLRALSLARAFGGGRRHRLAYRAMQALRQQRRLRLDVALRPPRAPRSRA